MIFVVVIIFFCSHVVFRGEIILRLNDIFIGHGILVDMLSIVVMVIFSGHGIF